MERSASAAWSGDLQQGQGKFTVASGAFKDQKFSFRTRFESEPGTNPKSSSRLRTRAASVWR